MECTLVQCPASRTKYLAEAGEVISEALTRMYSSVTLQNGDTVAHVVVGCSSGSGAAPSQLGKHPRGWSNERHTQQHAPLELELTLEELFAGCVKHLALHQRLGYNTGDGDDHSDNEDAMSTDSDSSDGGGRRRRPGGSKRGSGLDQTAANAAPVVICPGLRSGTTVTIQYDPGCGGALPASCGSSRTAGGSFALSFVVREAPHKVFRRLGNNLLAVVPVPLLVALTGGRVYLRQLDGRPLEISLPEDSVTQPGHVITFKGLGMPTVGNPSHRGNLHVRLQVQFPSNAFISALGAAQRARLRHALGS